MFTIREVLLLQEEILRHISLSSLLRRPELIEGPEAATAFQSPYGFACTFYGIKPIPTLPLHKNSSSIPFASAFDDMASLSITCGRRLIVSAEPLTLRDVFVRLLLLVGQLIEKLEGMQDVPITVSWNPTEWVSVMLGTFELEVLSCIVLCPSELTIRSDSKLHHCRSRCGTCSRPPSNKRTGTKALR